MPRARTPTAPTAASLGSLGTRRPTPTSTVSERRRDRRVSWAPRRSARVRPSISGSHPHRPSGDRRGHACPRCRPAFTGKDDAAHGAHRRPALRGQPATRGSRSACGGSAPGRRGSAPRDAPGRCSSRRRGASRTRLGRRACRQPSSAGTAVPSRSPRRTGRSRSSNPPDLCSVPPPRSSSTDPMTKSVAAAKTSESGGRPATRPAGRETATSTRAGRPCSSTWRGSDAGQRRVRRASAPWRRVARSSASMTASGLSSRTSAPRVEPAGRPRFDTGREAAVAARRRRSAPPTASTHCAATSGEDELSTTVTGQPGERARGQRRSRSGGP